ncbi:glycosyltransferase family 4 protein [Hoeflea prorocentri]|uniref:Glycosyltransferase family 4 protein n=1 Tax=Hoeflea prorocentri TaxID=1922333 RepID=A0A9X3UN63_9HYPH|nr:glycosyltransferase family 4 protein [Hoeflea prorocentri]MCY6383465.1 glycosyltransferase family 4 protein [Hoeflea prorocentri]MDA5401265.1 glycosyltransferase family 4 protein [Hoeflea prorocentri]
MKIAHIVSHWERNGVTSSCHSLIAAQLQRGHEVHLVHRSGAWLSLQDFPTPLTALGSSLETRPAEIRRIGYDIRDRGCDVIHCHGSRANKYGMVFRIAANAAVVTTAHSRNVQIPFAFFKAVIAPSHQTAAFHTRFNLVARSKIHVIPNFVPISPQPPDRTRAKTALRTLLGLPPDAFTIGMVGSVGPRKNQTDGLRILRELVAIDPRVKLVVVGSLHHAKRLEGWETLLNDPQIEANVVLTGHRDDAPSMIGGFDVLLSTSKKEEGPVVVLEAMSQTVPVVSYLTGQVPDLIRSGTDGFAVAVGDWQSARDAIGALLKEPGLAETVGLSGRQRLQEKCGENAVLAEIERVYERVTDTSRTASSRP